MIFFPPFLSNGIILDQWWNQTFSPCVCVCVTTEAEERAKKEAEERAQQEATMEPQEAQSQTSQPEPKENKMEQESPSESSQVSRQTDGNKVETDEGERSGSTAQKDLPPLHNGLSPSHGL